jgi:hypothetical protein
MQLVMAKVLQKAQALRPLVAPKAQLLWALVAPRQLDLNNPVDLVDMQLAHHKLLQPLVLMDFAQR